MKNQLVYRPTMQNVFVEDALERRDIDVVVPHAFRIDDQNGPASADAQAVCQGAFDALRIAQFGQTVRAQQLHKTAGAALRLASGHNPCGCRETHGGHKAVWMGVNLQT